MVYRYKVKWCFDEKTPINEGIGIARSFREAMEQMISHFGDEEILDIQLTWLIDADIADFQELLEALEPSVDNSTDLGAQMIEALADLISLTEEAAE